MNLIRIGESPENQVKTFLRRPIRSYTKVNSKNVDKALQLLEEMYHRNGIGLAANQVGLDLNLFVVDVGVMYGRRTPLVCFNPRITPQSEETIESREQCLSIPNKTMIVPRYTNILFSYDDWNGATHTLELGSSTLSVVIQHEYDHLQGILAIDKAIRVIEDTEVPTE